MIKRGELYLADLSPIVGSEQGGKRPVLIVQNNVGNRFSPTIIVAAVTTHVEKNRLPTHIFLNGEECGLNQDSIVLLEQIRAIDKSRLGAKIGSVPTQVLKAVDYALQISLGVSK